MNVKRLTRLVQILENMRPEKPFFDNDFCVTVQPLADGGYFSLASWARTNLCGTCACAMGWACLDSEFQQEGLKLVDGIMPMFEAEIGYKAAGRFFDMPGLFTTFVFSPSAYASNPDTPPAEVAHRLRWLIVTLPDLSREQGDYDGFRRGYFVDHYLQKCFSGELVATAWRQLMNLPPVPPAL